MIVEDERDSYEDNYTYDQAQNDISTSAVSSGPGPIFTTLLQRRAHMRQRQNHRQLQADLVDHIWERFGHENNDN